jgi:hypothetical protein
LQVKFSRGVNKLMGCFRPLPSLLATPMRSGSVVNSPAFIPRYTEAV